MIQKISGSFFRYRTLKHIKFDLLRAKARWFKRRNRMPAHNQLHLGCGDRKITDWLNVDIAGSDYNYDIACGKLPWKSDVFTTIVSQHVIDDLELERELIPLLKELNRTLKKDGELWLSCPDIEKVCKSYLENKCVDLIKDRQERIPDYSTNGYPSTQFINDLFYEGGVNINFFDFELLSFVLKEKCNFSEVRRTSEMELIQKYKDFPARNDDKQSLYVIALK